jgi:imidazolonepropionase-like amidohydrolase
LVEAGLTPLQALQTATLNPARVLKVADSLGSVERGRLADLVLLDANPLEDIRNTRRIRAVVANGQVYQRADLDQLLAAGVAAEP